MNVAAAEQQLICVFITARLATPESFRQKRRGNTQAVCVLWSRGQNERVSSFGRLLAVIGAVFVLAVCVAGFGLWRVEGSLDADKQKILAAVDEFAACLYRADVACLSSKTVWDEKLLGDALARAKQIQAELGARGKSAPIKNSWSMRKYSSLTLSVTTTIRLSLSTSFENDPDVREWFEIVEQSGTLRVRNFRVSSPKLPAQAKLLVR